MLYQVVSNVSEKVELFIEEDMTVGEVRTLVGEMVTPGGVEGKTLLLTFQGHVLADDTVEWSSILKVFPPQGSIGRKLFVHVSNKAKEESASIEALRAALPSSATKMEDEKIARAQAQMMEPMIDAMAKNPGFFDMVMSMQPELQYMVKKHPEMEQTLRDPDALKSLLMSQFDPDQMRQMSRNTSLQLAQVSAHPGGEQLLERHVNSIMRDMEAGEMQHRVAGANVPESEARPDPTKEANNEALPNPWARPPSGGPNAPPTQPVAQPHMFPWMGNPFALTNRGGQSATGANDAIQWAAEIATLKDMGFEDEALCIEALRATGGDVDKAVNFIVERMMLSQ